MLLPEPLHTFSSIDIKMLGLEYSSVIFDATIPITPGCQFSEANIITFSLEGLYFC